MRHDTRSKIAWASWMTGGAVVLSVLAWEVTESVGWAIVALLAAGPVLNAVAQMVVRPVRAVRRSTRPDDRGGAG
jgi:4-hydroxybenzoate polyprenyltransferase